MDEEDLHWATEPSPSVAINEPSSGQYIIFTGSRDGESFEIARINIFTGEVTYDVPDAGRESAAIFWESFGSHLASMVDRYILTLDRDR